MTSLGRIRLKPAYSLADLHLTKLHTDDHYALPAGALTRAGTLSSPPPYSQVNIQRAAEPSSHSSSVQGQPEADYHARQHRTCSLGFRVITVQSGTADSTSAQTSAELGDTRKARASSNPAVAGLSRRLGLGMRVELPAAAPTVAMYKCPILKPRKISSIVRSNHTAATSAYHSLSTPALPTGFVSPTLPTSPLSPTTQLVPKLSNSNATIAKGTQKKSTIRPTTSRVQTSGPVSSESLKSSAPPSGNHAVANGSAGFGSAQPAGQGTMPLTALVIGPGVQGAVGRRSNPVMGHSGPGSSKNRNGGTANGRGSGAAEYGNAKAFTRFTAAGREVGHRALPCRAASYSRAPAAETYRRHMQQTLMTGTLELLPSSLERALALEDFKDAAATTDVVPTDPARAAVDAAQRRMAVARAATAGALESSPHPASPQSDEVAEGASPQDVLPGPKKAKKASSSKHKKEKVVLPKPPVLPPITNLAAFSQAAPIESDLRPMLIPAYSPLVAASPSSSPRLLQNLLPASGSRAASPAFHQRDLHRMQSSAAESRASSGTHDDLSALPVENLADQAKAHDPHRPSVCHWYSATSKVDTDNGSCDSKHNAEGGNGKGTSRLARLATPGLGLAPKPTSPLLQMRISSNKSVSSVVHWATHNTSAGKDPEAAGWSAQNRGSGRLETAERGTVANKDTGHPTEPPPNIGNDSEAASASKPQAKLSKADRRYLEYQKQRSSEVSRQSQAEQERLKQAERARLAKEKGERKQREERRERKEREKWEIWEEVRKRAELEKNRGRQREREVLSR